MEAQRGTETPQTQAAGTLEKFHLGLAADGTNCAMVFVDDQNRSIYCIASVADLDGFIISLKQAAAEMERRRAERSQDGASFADNDSSTAMSMADGPGTMNVAASEFRAGPEEGDITGTLVGDDGQFIAVRMGPSVANEMTRNMLRAGRPSSRC